MVIVALVEGSHLHPLRPVFHSAAAFAALAWAIYRQKREERDLLTELQCLDARFGLDDRLSTAYEYLKKGKDSLFKTILLEDAAKVLMRLPPKKVLPFPLTMVDLTLPMVFTLLVLFHQVFFPLFFPSPKGSQGPPPYGAKAVRDFFSPPVSETAKKDEQPSEELGRELQEWARKGEDPSVSRERLLQALGKMQTAVQERRTGWGLNRIKGLEGGQEWGNRTSSPPSPEGSLSARNPFTESLSNQFGRDLSESPKRDLAPLREVPEGGGYRGRTLKLFLAPEKKGEPGGVLTIMKEGQKGAPDEKGRSSPFRPHGEKGAEGSLGLTAQVETKAGLKPEPGERPLKGKEGPFGPGSEKGTGERMKSGAIPTGQGPVFRENGIPSGSAAPPSFSFLSKPFDEREETAREQLIGVERITPSKSREAVIRPERIPQEYREVVKQYFLFNREKNGIRIHEQSR